MERGETVRADAAIAYRDVELQLSGEDVGVGPHQQSQSPEMIGLAVVFGLVGLGSLVAFKPPSVRPSLGSKSTPR